MHIIRNSPLVLFVGIPVGLLMLAVLFGSLIAMKKAAPADPIDAARTARVAEEFTKGIPNGSVVTTTNDIWIIVSKNLPESVARYHRNANVAWVYLLATKNDGRRWLLTPNDAVALSRVVRITTPDNPLYAEELRKFFWCYLYCKTSWPERTARSGLFLCLYT